MNAPTRARSGAHRGALSRALANTATITARNLRRYKRVPTLLAFATVQPIMLVLLFTSVFGGAIHPPGAARYVDYVLPGILVLALGFGASQTGVAIAEDLNRGMIDRFRALPTARLAVLAGRTLADAIRNAFVIALVLVVGTLQGFRFHAGAAGALGAIAVALAAGWAFSWACALLGLIIRDAESAGLGRTARRDPAHLHQLDLRARRLHAQRAASVREHQPRHQHRRWPTRPLPRRPSHPTGP